MAILRQLSEAALQDLFNQLRVWERHQEGELRVVLLSNGPWKRKKGDLKDTRWERWSFRDQNDHEIARTCQHVRKRGGTLAASGLPDPEQVFRDGTIYVLDKSL